MITPVETVWTIRDQTESRMGALLGDLTREGQPSFSHWPVVMMSRPWSAADRKQVQDNQSAEEGEDHRYRRARGCRSRVKGFAPVQSAKDLDMVPDSDNIPHDSQRNQRRPDPQGEPGRPWRRRMMLCGQQFPQKKTEAGNDKPEAHQGKPGPYPGEQGSLGGENNAGIDGSRFRGSTAYCRFW